MVGLLPQGNGLRLRVTSSATSAAVLEVITDAVEVDPTIVASDAEVFTGGESMYRVVLKESEQGLLGFSLKVFPVFLQGMSLWCYL